MNFKTYPERHGPNPENPNQFIVRQKLEKHQLSVWGPFTPITINQYDIVWLYVRNAIFPSLEQHIALPIEVRILFGMVQFMYRFVYFLG